MTEQIPRYSQPSVPRAPRDPRLDFFRGIGMFIIFIAHMPRNFLTLWIPARFGFSDATEIFVFCSGVASALAFGRVYSMHGWPMGTARIAHRVWQVYWAHIGVFFVIAAMVYGADQLLGYDNRYVGGLNLGHFFNRTGENLIGLMTLTYVPNYFDILPMYLVILAMIPIVVGLGRINPLMAGLFVAIMWVLATARLVDLPAEPWSERTWFFNPFAWQLVFFTGFAFGVGWLKPPPIKRSYVIAALAVVLISVPFDYFRILNEVPALKEISRDLAPLKTKTRFGILRYIHFLALAYLAYAAGGDGGHRLIGSGLWGRVVGVIRKVGQQSLAVFLAGLVLARLGGMVLDQIGRSYLSVTLVTLAGCFLLIGVAYLVAWYKGQPWRKPPSAHRPPGPEPISAPLDTTRSAPHRDRALTGSAP